MPKPIKVWIEQDDGSEVEVELPTVFEVCDRCQGEGKHVNPSIDGHGLTAEDFAEAGPEFEEDYFSGLYDVPCHECKGERVVAVPDESRADPEHLESYRVGLRVEAELRAEEEAERRFGC